MAKIAFGFGTSHGPLLSTPPDQWHLRRDDDMKNPEHPFRDGTYTFDELVELRKDEDLEHQWTLQVRQERHRRCQEAIAKLAEEVARARPDVLVIVGNDQRELFLEDITPAYTVYFGDEIPNRALSEEHKKGIPPGILVSSWANKPPQDAFYPAVPDLATHIIGQAMEEGFDVTVSKKLPKGRRGDDGIPHAYGFIYRRILNDIPIPAVPIIQNTFYPPNQPTAQRCYAFGKMIARAVESWDGEKRVGIVASGGLSHFVVDEEFDQRVLKAMQTRDEKTLTTEPEHSFRSGTSETKNWITAMGAMAATDLEMQTIDYVPCYRSEAGTGNAMAFAYWR